MHLKISSGPAQRHVLLLRRRRLQVEDLQGQLRLREQHQKGKYETFYSGVKFVG